MTLDTILSMDPEYPGDIAIKIEERISERKKTGDTLSEEENVFLEVYWLEMDLGSGGFSTFFHSKGHETNKIMSYLELVKATPICDLLKKAISVFPKGNVPEDEDKFLKILDDIFNEDEEKIEELWSELDDEYFDEYEGEIFGYLVEYVKTNKDKFK